MAALEEIVESLASFEVHPGFPDQRRQLAGRLLAEGVTPADIDLLGDHCARTVGEREPGDRRAPGSPGASGGGNVAATRVLIALLTDPVRRQSRLNDLRDIARARAERLARQSPATRPTVFAPQEGENHEQWRQDRECTIAYARAVRDGRGRQVAADELGVSVDRIDQMIERGRELSRSGHARLSDKP